MTDGKSETPGKSIYLPLAVCQVPDVGNPEVTTFVEKPAYMTKCP